MMSVVYLVLTHTVLEGYYYYIGKGAFAGKTLSISWCCRQYTLPI